MPRRRGARVRAISSGRQVFAPLLLALVVALGISGATRAASAAPAPSALVVFGKAEQRIQDIVLSVVDRVLRQAGWPLVPALAENEATIVRGCLSKESPWPCLENMASRKGIERIVAVRVELEKSSDGTSQVVLTGRLVYAGSSSVLEQKRYCGACSDEDLTAYSEEISKLLMDERAVQAGTTKVGVTSTPMGAEVRIDGKVVGLTNGVFSTFPGKHTVEVRARGHKPETRSVTALDGKTVTTSMVLQVDAGGGGDGTGPVISGGGGGDGSGGAEGTSAGFRRWGPKAMVGTGVALVVTGAIFAFVLDEERDEFDNQDQLDADPTYQDWTPSGVAFMAGGAILAGAGGYLWWKWMPSSTTPTVATTPSGAVMGLSGSF